MYFGAQHWEHRSIGRPMEWNAIQIQNWTTTIEKSWKTETKLQFYFSFFIFVYILVVSIYIYKI